MSRAKYCRPLFAQPTVAVLALAIAQAAHGETVAVKQYFNIPAQPLNQALLIFGRQSGLQIMYGTEIVDNLHSHALQGDYTATEALNILLSGTPLRAISNGEGVISLQHKPGAANDKPDPSTMPAVHVTGQAVYAPDDPYNPDYNRPNATTATKTDTPIMETPANIQIIPKAILSDQQVVRIDKALQNVSGVYSQSGDSHQQSSTTIRGFQTFDYYRNGTRISAPWITDGFRETANLERIEVLKGIASILYGRIEPGGMLNVVTKMPLATPYYSLQQQFGSFDFYRTTADATGPITKDGSLIYRVNFAYEDAGSYRDFVNNDRVFFAPVLQWNISDKTQVTLELEYKHSNDTFDQGLPAIGDRPANVPIERNLAGPNSQTQESDSFWAGLNWSHAFNDRWKISHKFDGLIANFPLNPGISVNGPSADCNMATCDMIRKIRTSNWSGEQYYTSVDLTGKLDTGPIEHTLLFGWDYYNSSSSSGIAKVANAPNIDLYHPVYSDVPLSLLNDPNFTDTFSIDESWYGFYLQDQVKLPFNLHLLAGFRYDDANVSTSDMFTPRASTTSISNGSQSAHAVKPRFGIVWQPLHELSFYGNYVENFGLSNTFSQDQFGKPLPPQTAEQLEIGVKTQLLDDRFTASLAWFDLTKHNIATPHPDPTLAARGVAINTGEVNNQGLELDFSGELYPGLRMIGSYAYTESKITQDNSGNEGHRFFNVPRHAGSFWATYELPDGVLRGLKFGAGALMRGQREGDSANSFQLPGYATMNLMSSYSWRLHESKITTQLNIDNVLDKTYYTSSQNFGRMGIFAGMPLTFMGSIKVEF